MGYREVASSALGNHRYRRSARDSIISSIHKIGPTQIGLVIKRFSFKKLSEDNVIAFKKEAGYQAELLMPGLRFKLWPLFKVLKYPWVQVPAGEIGVVIAQVGEPLPIGAKSAVFKSEFGNYIEPAMLHRQRRAEGRAAPGAPPGYHVAHPPGGLPGDHQEPGLRPARLPRPEEAGRQGRQALPAVLRAGPLAAGPGAHLAPAGRAVGRAHRHGGHRHHLRGRSPAIAGAIASRLGVFDDVTNLEGRRGR